MAADIFETPIVVPEVQEAAAFGASLQSLWIYNQSDINDIVREHVRLNSDKSHTPIESNVRLYKSVYSEYSKYLESLKSIFS